MLPRNMRIIVSKALGVLSFYNKQRMDIALWKLSCKLPRYENNTWNQVHRNNTFTVNLPWPVCLKVLHAGCFDEQWINICIVHNCHENRSNQLKPSYLLTNLSFIISIGNSVCDCCASIHVIMRHTYLTTRFIWLEYEYEINKLEQNSIDTLICIKQRWSGGPYQFPFIRWIVSFYFKLYVNQYSMQSLTASFYIRLLAFNPAALCP